MFKYTIRLWYFVILVTSLSFFILACSENFRREQASDLILGSQEIKDLMQEVPLHSNGYKNGIEQEYWDKAGVSTQKGKKNSILSVYLYHWLKLKMPLEISIDVTGIKDTAQQGIKEAEFVWKYENIPPIIKRFIFSGGNGNAFFTKYDDGWRLDGINIYSNIPCTLTPQEIAQEQVELAQIKQERLEKEERERRERERIAKVIEKSKTPSRTLIQMDLGTRSTGKKNIATITDVGVHNEYNDYGSWGKQYCWFGEITSIKKHKSTTGVPTTYHILVYGAQSRCHCNIASENEKEIDKLLNIINKSYQEWKINYPTLP